MKKKTTGVNKRNKGPGAKRGGGGREGLGGAGSAPSAPHARTLITLRRGLEDNEKNIDFVGILAYSAHRHFGVHVLAAERRGDSSYRLGDRLHSLRRCDLPHDDDVCRTPI